MLNISGAFADKNRKLYGPEMAEPLWFKNGLEPEFEIVEDGANGPELLLLHGLLGAMSNWESAFPLFSNFCKPIALKFPLLTGHRSEVKVGALAMYTELFLRKRSIYPAALCGNSLGGHVALRLCLASPEMVDCLVLAGTSGLYEHSVDALPVRPDRTFVREHMGRVFFNQKFVTDEAIEEIYDILKHKGNVINLIHAARSAKKDNLLSLLQQIRVPTLLLWGEDDLITTMDVADLFHKNIKNSKLVTIKNCGHAPMIEQPEWFSEQVRIFLQENSRYYLRSHAASC